MNNSIKSPIYAQRPVCNLPEKIELPTNMYHLPTIEEICGKRSSVLLGIQRQVKKFLQVDSNPDIAIEFAKSVAKSLGNTVKLESETPLLNCEVAKSGCSHQAVENDTDLEKRWDRVLADLHDLADQLQQIRKSIDGKSVVNGLLALSGVAISANPKTPPYSLFLLRELFKDFVNFDIRCHTHSSVSEPVVNFPDSLNTKDVPKVSIVLIWKEGLLDTQLVLSPVKLQPILGEINILRFLARLGLDLGYNNELILDGILDQCHRLKYVDAKEKSAIFREMNERLGGKTYFGGSGLNIADVAAWSVLKQIGAQPAGGKLKTWFSSVDVLLPLI